MKDDPHLGVRLKRRNKSSKDPIRIILDSNLKIPLNAKVLRDSKIIIFTKNLSKTDQRNKEKTLIKKGINIISLNDLKIKNILKKLGENGISNVLVEGGSKIFCSFVTENLIDKFIFFLTPYIFGDRNSKSIFTELRTKNLLNAKNIKFEQVRNIDKDLFIEAYNL